MGEKIKTLLARREAKLLLALLAAAVLLLACTGKSRSAGEKSAAEGSSLAEYEARLTEEVAAAASAVNGAGECRVMIAFSGGFSRTYSGSKLVREEPPKVVGVTVICPGGKDAAVQAELTAMLTALFGIGANRVAVLPS